MAKTKFARGFKAWCERTASACRDELDIQHYDPLSPKALAQQLGVILLNLNDLDLTKESKLYLSQEAAREWSAVTVTKNGLTAIVLNEAHHGGRKNNSLMHELSHIILSHEPTPVGIFGETGIAIRSFDEKSETEADWLAGTLLLPKKALLFLKKSKMNQEEAVRRYGVSNQLYTFRLNVTGLGKFYRTIKPIEAQSNSRHPNPLAL